MTHRTLRMLGQCSAAMALDEVPENASKKAQTQQQNCDESIFEEYHSL
jgi:hypothetical protein